MYRVLTLRRLGWIVVSISLLALILASCSDDDPAAPEPPEPLEASGTVGAGGGTLQSDDGRLVVTIPAGALAADTDIAVTEVDPDTRTDLHPGIEPILSFAFDPAGLQLAQPATITVEHPLVTTSAKRSEARGIPATIAVVTSEDLQQTPTRSFAELTQLMKLQPGTLESSVTVRGFGNHLDLGQPLRDDQGTYTGIYLMEYWEYSEPVVENTEHNWDFRLKLNPTLSLVAGLTYREFEADGLDTDIADGTELDAVDEGTDIDGSRLHSLRMRYNIGNAGTGRLQLGLEYDIQFNDDEAWEEDLRIDGYGLFHLKSRFPLWSFPIELEDEPPPSEEVDLGTYQVEIGLEGMKIWGGITGWRLDNTVAVSGANGTSVLSLDKITPFQLKYDGLQTRSQVQYGSALGFAQQRKAAPAGLSVLTFGPGGAGITQWDNDLDDFGWTQIVAFSANVTDGQSYGGQADSGGIVYVNNSTGIVYLIEYDDQAETFLGAGSLLNFPGAPATPVSAAVRPGGSALVVTDGTPGRIYTHDRANLNDPAVSLGDAGDSPRRVRMGGGLAVISNFASDNLTVLTWSETDQIAIVGNVAVGDGPVGIDLRELPGGNVAVASTGFNDNTYTVTVLSPTGAVVSNQTTNLPAGATGPGHAVWLGPESSKILVSCNTSGHIAVVASGL
jgi:hypothetical protein